MKPFLQGRKVSELPSLHAAHALPSVAAVTPRSKPAAAAQPHIEVVKEGDKVARIIVTCACGEQIEVECLYSPGR
ncbi:MAG TPA: hypothetical protein VHE13_17335 [Opitutus sp.]|nr:hypothetical protein [Opitutus sp.]